MQTGGIMTTILATICSVLVTLIITFLFNKLIALPKAMKQQRAAEEAAKAAEKDAENQYKADIERRLKNVEGAVSMLPNYRSQSLQIQAELKAEQSEIIKLCKTMNETIKTMDTRLIRTQKQADERERNDLRQKLISEYRLFTNPAKNPMKAWSEMEYKAFMSQVKDYESLNGNDYIHKTVLPAMNELEVIVMDDTERLVELMSSRQI